MFARVTGSGRSVVLLHGAPSGTNELRELAQTLARDFRVVVPDLPGYGWSAATSDPPDLQRDREALTAALATHGVTQAYAVIGYSLGAYRALDLALAGEIRVERLGLIGGFANLTDTHRSDLAQLADSLADCTTFPDAMYAAYAERAVSAGWRERNPDRSPELRAALDNTSPAPFVRELRAMARSANLLASSPFTGPVMIRVGAQDALMPPPYSEAVAAWLGQACSIVPDVGHALLLEDAVGTIAAVERLLR
jgi:pimeloyl-ACP methyl ester carboxylesterase